MRMWNIDPRLMCRKHLCGEHVEMHMFVGSIRKGKSIDGHVRLGQVETARIGERHDALAAEMILRGYKHASPLKQPECEHVGHVDAAASLAELARRCPECYARQQRYAISEEG